jgi:hypothetical protein
VRDARGGIAKHIATDISRAGTLRGRLLAA